MSYELIKKNLHGFHKEYYLYGKRIRFYNFMGTHMDGIQLMQRHSYHEIFFKLEGNALTRVIDDNDEAHIITQKKNSLLFIRSDTRHAKISKRPDPDNHETTVILAFDVEEVPSLHEIGPSNDFKVFNTVMSAFTKYNYIYIEDCSDLYRHLDLIESCLADTSYGSALRVQNAIMGFFLSCISYLYQQIGDDEKEEPGKIGEISMVCRLFEYISDNCTKPLTIRTIADEIGYTPRHLQRIIKAYYGVNLSDLLLHLRLSRAREALAQGSESAETIARKCGFKNMTLFASSFFENYGMTPEDYLRSRGASQKDPEDVT